MPTPEEDARINAGIAADPDTYEPTEEEFKEMRPFKMRSRPVVAEGYKVMAADTEREKEALEWCNALIGDVVNK